MQKTSKYLMIISLLLYFQPTFCQSYNEEKKSISNFIERMYSNQSFEGVKVIEGYDFNYLISVISLNQSKYSSPSTMNRVAQVKAQSQANTFFNGSVISLDFVVKTTETRSKKSEEVTVETIESIESIESIKENSYGFVKGMELLTNFETDEGKRIVFIYFKKIENGEK